MKHLIALGHYSRTGKDTVGAILQRKLGGPTKCLLVSWAAPVKQTCHQLWGWAGVREPEYYDTPEGAAARDVILPKLGLTPVELWVLFGTILCRQGVHNDTWTELGRQLIEQHLAAGDDHWCIICDLRFPNEASLVRELDGVLVKVTRPGVAPKATVADMAMLDFDRWDFELYNNGTLHQLDRGVDLLLAELHRADGTHRIIEAVPTQPITLDPLPAIAQLVTRNS